MSGPPWSGVPRFSVGELTRALRELVGELFPSVEVVGEISDFKVHSSGHWYLTLKDEEAVLEAAFFRADNQRATWRPRIGERVRATGALDIYPPMGRYKLIIRKLERDGAGDLRARFEAMKARLEAEGLFDPARKRPLPPRPTRLGVVTSPTGAALQDVLRVVDTRFPGFPIVLSPCRVQGAGAAAEVAAALARLARHGRVDVIIVGRGGGSAEDLWTFNEEAVVRAIAACPIPVVSAVGHETDVTLADLAADVRAATPSHAAQLVVPDRDTLVEAVDRLATLLTGAARRQVALRRDRLARTTLRHPRRRIQEARLRCDELADRLVQAVRRRLDQDRNRLGRAADRLHATSPLAVLGRGYAIVRRGAQVVRTAGELEPDDLIGIRFAEGSATARVVARTTEPVPAAPRDPRPE